MTGLALLTTAPLAEERWVRLSRVTGVIGLVTFVLIFTPIIATSTLGEPPFTATGAEAHAFLIKAGAGWFQTAQAVVALAGIGLVWFTVGLVLLLAHAEGSPPWRSAIAGASGMLLPAYLLIDVSWEAAAYGSAEIEPGLAGYAFDVGNLGFANAWLGMASFALACGWVVVSTRALGRWLGWWAIVAGVGLMLSRFVWTSQAWLAPYFLFWIWTVVMCVQLIRGRVGRGGDQR